MAAYDFQVGTAYTFGVYPSTLLGTDYTGVTVMAVFDQATANLFTDTYAEHTRMYPYLPSGTPDDPTQYNWLKIKHANGNIEYLGVPWVNASSIVVYSMKTITAVIGNVTPDQLTDIKNALSANGFTSVTLTVSS
jgi:hypothetical protein